MAELGDRLARVRESIAAAARDAGRDPDGITTIVVTKFHPAALVRELAAHGVRDVGENRHQDAEPKAADLADLDLTWHFVGQLQSKKARQVLGYSRVIHSLDRPSLIETLDVALDGSGGTADCFVQVNLTGDPGRGGVAPSELEKLVERVLESPRLTLLGLMAVAPLGEDARRSFSRVADLSAVVQRSAPAADKLSMGMSGDYREAILEGATHLRIGTAITGNRPVRD